MKPQIWKGQFVGLMFSLERNREYINIISQKFLLFITPFTGTREPANGLTWRDLTGFVAQFVWALHRHHRDHGFESRRSHLKIFRCTYETLSWIGHF